MRGQQPSPIDETFTVIDCVAPFVAFWPEGAGGDAKRIAGQWQSDYHDRLPEAIQRAVRRHRFADDLALAVPKMTTVFETLLARHDAVIQSAQAAISRYADLPGGRAAPFQVAPFQLVTLVGAFAADSWVEWDDGQATLLIAVEALESIDQVEILMAHEVAHVLHLQLLAADERWDLSDALFEEGLATALSGLGTDVSDGVLCAAGRTTTWQGEPVNDWLTRCALTWPDIRSSLLAEFSSESADAYAALFLGGDDSSGFPSRAGYYAGLRLVRALAERTSWREIVNWDRDTARSELLNALRDE